MKSVRVVAATYPQENWSEHRVRAGQRLSTVISKLGMAGYRVGATINGNVIPMDRYRRTTVKSGDLVNLKAVPAMSPSGWLGLGVGLGSLALLWALGGGGSKATAATQNNPVSPAPEPPADPPLPPEDNYGGPASSIVPAIMGVSNRKNNWGPLPSVYGTVQVAPVVIADPYILTEGSEQWLYAAMTFGIGQVDITNIMVGAKSIDELVAAGVCQYELRYGSPSDYLTPLTLYTQDVNTVSPGVTLSTVAQTYTAGQDCNKLSVDIEVTGGLYAQRRLSKLVGPGLVITYSPNDPFTLVAHTITFNVEYRLHGSSGAWSSRTVSRTAQTTETLLLGDTWTVATAGLYDVRITKTSSDAAYTLNEAIPGGQTATYTITPNAPSGKWKALRSIKTAAPINFTKDINGNYHPWSFIAIKIKASELIGETLDNLTAVVKRYLKTWNGSAWTAPIQTNNPAWAMVDVLTGYINNSRITTDLIDVDAFYEFAQWCTTNGFEYNKPIDEFTEPLYLLEEIARHGLGEINAVDSKYTVIIDKPKSTIVQMFGGANTNNLQVSGGWRDLPHGVKIKFMNPDADWNPDEITVYDDGYDANNATRFESIEYPGLTSATAAYVLGRRHLVAARLRRKKYTLEVDYQHLVAKRGDLAKLNYDVSFDGLGSSLIKSVQDDGTYVTSITLEQQVTMTSGESYGFEIRFNDHTIQDTVFPINTVAGNQHTLTLTTPIALSDPHIPHRGDLVFFGRAARISRKVLIDEIENLDDLKANITFVDYAPSVFDAATGPVPDYVPSVDIVHPTRRVINPPVISGIDSSENVILKTGKGLISRIQLTLDPPTSTGVAYVQTQFRLTGEESWSKGSNDAISGGLVAYVSNVTDGAQYDVRVRFVTNGGNASDWTYNMAYTVVGKSSKPPDIPRLLLQGTRAVAKYDTTVGVTVPIDYAGIQFRWAQGTSAIWEQMQILYEATTNQEIELGSLPAGDIVVAAKAIDVVGNLSENAAYLTTNIQDSFQSNTFIEVPEHPTWSGTKTNGTIHSTELWADDAGSQFYSDTPGSQFYSNNPSSAAYASSYLPLVYEWKYVPDGDLAKPYKIFVNVSVQADVFFVEYKRNPQGAFYGAGDSQFYPSTNQFYPDDPSADVWYPFPQEGLQGTREQYSFRIRCLASSTRSKILQASVIVDVPDVEEYLDDIVILANGGAGTVLPTTKSYRQITSCIPTLQYDALSYPGAIGGNVQIQKSGTTITARVYNASGTITDGLCDFKVRGI